MSTDDTFDVAAERDKKVRTQQKTWTGKRKTMDAEIRTNIEDALNEADPCEANKKLAALELAIKKRKLANAKAQMLTLKEKAREKFGVSEEINIFYLDPPWQYADGSHLLGTDKQYETMSFEELSALPIAGLAAQDAVMVMWTTFYMLDAALSLMAAYGFEYKTVFTVWVKVDRAGNPYFSMGDYTMPCAEFALMGIRGTLQIKQRKDIINSVIRARPNGHSRKPPAVRDQIVRLFGDLPRMELFGRGRVPGWIVWGNQTNLFANDLVFSKTPVDETAYIPRVIDRKKQVSDRAYKVSANGSAQSFTSVSVATSFGRLYYEFDADSVANNSDKNAAEEHDHDGTRRCCLPVGDTIPDNVLSHITMIDGYLQSRTGYHNVRNSLYNRFSEATVREHEDNIRQQQRHNADILFAINYNKTPRRPNVRVAQPPVVAEPNS